MRFSPLMPSRRRPFGRRLTTTESSGLASPSSEERRLIDRLLRRAGYRDSR